MGNFFAELKRRNLYRVSAAYAVAAWVLIQIVNNVAPIMEAPAWVARVALLFLALGFPVALTLVWAFEGRTPTEAPIRAKSGAVDWLLAGAAAAVIGMFVYQQAPQAPSQGAPQQASVAATPQPDGISIAVLPFANLSDDRQQEFFSDGMTDEIISALAKVRDLRVVGRSSAFQYKGQNRDLRAIGEALRARFLIDGSVRMAGNRVRITAQLVQANDGIGLWTDNYDRELTDIFAIQEDIAQAIASALRVPLGLQQGERLVPNRSINSDSYQQYLRAKALVRGRGLKPVMDAAVLLEQVVARDADYAPAWALLSLAYSLIPTFEPVMYGGSSLADMRRLVDGTIPKAEAAAQRAIELDANLADGYSSLGLVERVHGKLLLAEELYSKALALDPGNPDALHLQGRLLSDVARLKEALALRLRLRAMEPFVPIFNAASAQVLWLNGQNDAAIALIDEAQPFRTGPLAEMYAATGRYREAADLLIDVPTELLALSGGVKEASQILRTAPARAASPETLPRLDYSGFVFLHVGAPERAIEFYESHIEAGYASPFDFARVWHPSYVPLRKTERFKAYVRKAGLLDYWRAKGWPEFCRPTAGDDFACE